jgi:hypothetical protein
MTTAVWPTFTQTQIIIYLNIFIHGSLSVACFSKGRGLKLLKRYKTKSKPKV